MLTQDQSLDVERIDIEVVSKERSEAASVEHCPEAQHLSLRDYAALSRQMGQDVHRVGDDDDGCALRPPARAAR